MPPSAHLAVDLGAESGRGIVGVLDDTRLALHEVHRFQHGIVQRPSGLHWDLPALRRGTIEALRQAAAWSAANNVPLRSVGVDTWGVDFALVNGAGEPLGLPRCYRDPRNVAAFEAVVARVGRDALYARTGNQLLPINTLFQLAACRATEPATLAAAERLLFMPDLMHRELGGVMATEATIASTSQMLDARGGVWATSLLESLDLPTRLLGEIVPAGSVLGPLRSELAAEFGLTGTQVVAPAAHDTASAVAAVPADPATAWCYISSGTWSLMGVELDQPCLSNAAGEAPFTNERGLGGTIRFQKNMTGLWLVQECRRSFDCSGRPQPYHQLVGAAALAEPFRTIIYPDHPPFGASGDLPRKIVEFARMTGQPVPEAPGQFVRCCFESLALAYRHVLARLESVLAQRFDVVHVVGGGARNRLLSQMTADATNRDVIAGPAEATAMGNTLVQAMGLGVVADRFELRRIVRQSVCPETFAPHDAASWDGAYNRFLTLL